MLRFHQERLLPTLLSDLSRVNDRAVELVINFFGSSLRHPKLLGLRLPSPVERNFIYRTWCPSLPPAVRMLLTRVSHLPCGARPCDALNLCLWHKHKRRSSVSCFWCFVEVKLLRIPLLLRPVSPEPCYRKAMYTFLTKRMASKPLLKTITKLQFMEHCL